jgi:hypothetical protein
VVFGPDTIQAEVFDDVKGLVQSAVDGYNALLMVAGPRSTGKTYTMLGEQGASGPESKGLLPRVVDELFAIRERDRWRANLEVDVQMVAVQDARRLADMLGRSGGGLGRTGVAAAGLGPCVKLVSQAFGRTFSAGLPGFVVVDGAVTRRITERSDMQKLLQESTRGALALAPEAAHVVLLSLTRTNIASGEMLRSKFALVDLAGGMGSGTSPEAQASYAALERVLGALSREERRPPFREHVLTQVLQDCLGGNARGVMILTLSPDAAECANSFKAIKFACSCGW